MGKLRSTEVSNLPIVTELFMPEFRAPDTKQLLSHVGSVDSFHFTQFLHISHEVDTLLYKRALVRLKPFWCSAFFKSKDFCYLLTKAQFQECLAVVFGLSLPEAGESRWPQQCDHEGVLPDKTRG